jgi:Tat protein secretion system quality control protein TatD with DNase activity
VIAAFIAELRDISLQELAEQTNENAQRLFKLPLQS